MAENMTKLEPNNTKRHTQKMRTSRRCFSSYMNKFIYKKVMARLTIISRMVYSTSSTSYLFLKVNDCKLSKKLTPPRLQYILVLGRQSPTYIGMCIGP
jgi:hypothetical protein